MLCPSSIRSLLSARLPLTLSSPFRTMRWMCENDRPGKRASRKRSTRMPFSSAVTVTVWTLVGNGVATASLGGSAATGVGFSSGLATTRGGRASLRKPGLRSPCGRSPYARSHGHGRRGSDHSAQNYAQRARPCVRPMRRTWPRETLFRRLACVGLRSSGLGYARFDSTGLDRAGFGQWLSDVTAHDVFPLLSFAQ